MGGYMGITTLMMMIDIMRSNKKPQRKVRVFRTVTRAARSFTPDIFSTAKIAAFLRKTKKTTINLKKDE